MKRNLFGAGALAMAALAPLPATAQQAEMGIHAGELMVAINKSQVVTADVAIDRAMVGNAEIADVVPISERSVYVLGKGMGTTSLTLYDRGNRVIAVMDISVGPDVDGLMSQLNMLVPGQQIDASVSNGSLVLSGLVSDPGSIDRATRVAAAYAGDKVINLLSLGGSQQVMLEVRFAEINRTIGEEIGVSGFAFSDDGDFGGAQGRGAAVVPGLNGGGGLQLDQILNKFGVFSGLFEVGDVSIEAFLDLLESKGMARTLAEPTLVALSGERASFLAGGEFPIPVAQSSGGAGAGGGVAAITVEFKPFGVSLAFTPTVLGGGVINLVVEQGVSSIDPSASVTVSGLTVPGLQTRRAETVLEMRDGESFAIAGLLRDETTTSIQQLPLLGSIPILGSLFRSTEYQKGQTELLIVVTPRLVQPIHPDQVRLPTDRVADPIPAEVLLNGDDYQPQTLAPPAPVPSVEGSDYEF